MIRLTLKPLTPAKRGPGTTDLEAGRAPGLVSIYLRRDKSKNKKKEVNNCQNHNTMKVIR